MQNLPNIEQAVDLLDGLNRLIAGLHWSYCAQLERLKLFKTGHDQDAESWYGYAQCHIADQNLQQLAEGELQSAGFMDLILAEFEGHSGKYQGLMRSIDEVKVQLGILQFSM